MNQVEYESLLIANERIGELVEACQKQEWSFAYVQFSSNRYRYSSEKFE